MKEAVKEGRIMQERKSKQYMYKQGILFLLGLVIMWISSQIGEYMDFLSPLLTQLLYALTLLGGAYISVRAAQRLFES